MALDNCTGYPKSDHTLFLFCFSLYSFPSWSTWSPSFGQLYHHECHLAPLWMWTNLTSIIILRDKVSPPRAFTPQVASYGRLGRNLTPPLKLLHYPSTYLITTQVHASEGCLVVRTVAAGPFPSSPWFSLSSPRGWLWPWCASQLVAVLLLAMGLILLVPPVGGSVNRQPLWFFVPRLFVGSGVASCSCATARTLMVWHQCQ